MLALLDDKPSDIKTMSIRDSFILPLFALDKNLNNSNNFNSRNGKYADEEMEICMMYS